MLKEVIDVSETVVGRITLTCVSCLGIVLQGMQQDLFDRERFSFERKGELEYLYGDMPKGVVLLQFVFDYVQARFRPERSKR